MSFLTKELTKVGVEAEITEGVYQPPQADTSYIQPLDGFSIVPAKETKERSILTEGYAMARPRVGQKSVAVQIATEMRGSGEEGGQTDFHILMKSLLGGNRELAARVTTGTGHSATEIFMSAVDVAKFTVNDIVVILEAGAHHIAPITAIELGVGIESITILIPGAGAFSDAVEIAKFQTYFPSNTLTDYPTLSMSFYHGNEVRESGHGLRPASMSLTSFSTGELAQFDWNFEGISFNEIIGQAPHTPDFDSGTPPLILSACIFQDTTNIDLNEFNFSVENSLGFITSTCSADGRIASRLSGKRAVKGKFNPYKDSASIENFTKFSNNTPFSLFAFAANPSETTVGEYELGSIVSFWFPQCISTGKQVSDLEGNLIEDIDFTADGGDAGELDEIFIGLT